MPSISYDARSFMINGQRVWLVSGSIHYPRVPRELWRARIRAAKQAGLNCITTYAFWNVHEQAPGKFDFEGDRDLRRFVEIIGEEGMYCILRPGPYVCSEWDFGGFPAWLHNVKDIAYREANGPFLESVSRYFTAVLNQVGDMQVTSRASAGKPRPIILMQAENEWMCDHPAQAAGYLFELTRYLREAGCTVPILSGNNLWARVEGTIDTWNANEHLMADLRQLSVVQPEAPRLMTEYWAGWFDVWGRKSQSPTDAARFETSLMQILAAGAQYNIYMFHGGTNFGFTAGLSGSTRDGYVTTSYDSDAPLGETGHRGEKYNVAKRISMFASHFGHVLANLDPQSQHAAVAPDDRDGGISVIHQRGGQGEIVFVFAAAGKRPAQFDLLLSDGQTLPVPIGDDAVCWLAMNVNLGGTAVLTYTNLRPWAFIDQRMLVLFGPAGAAGVVCIDDAPLEVKVPAGKTPLVQEHEELTVVVLNKEQVDAAYVDGDSLIIGASGLDEDGDAIALKGWSKAVRIAADGATRSRSVGTVAKAPAAPKLGKWQCAGVDDVLSGQAAELKPIDGPASLEQLGVNFGYGWYHLKLKTKSQGKLLIPQSGDRLHVFHGEKPAALIGHGPGATNKPAPLAIDQRVTILADNLGRNCFGWGFGESKGLFGHLYMVEPVKLPKPKIIAGVMPDPFELGGYIKHMSHGERHPADTLTWEINGKGTHGVAIDIDDLACPAMLFVNDQAHGLYHPLFSGGFERFTLVTGQTLKRGRNILKLALFEKFDPKKHALGAITMYRSKLQVTSGAQWSFAPWTPPDDAAFEPVGNTRGQLPCWLRTTFAVKQADQPLWLEPNGMTKGQIYLNGRNVGRYFVATADGKPVDGQKRYYLPQPWLHTDQPNELMLFDEHGCIPSRVRLTYGP